MKIQELNLVRNCLNHKSKGTYHCTFGGGFWIFCHKKFTEFGDSASYFFDAVG